MTTAQCHAAFDANGVPSSPYRTVREVMEDPQLAHRGAFAEVHDAGGSFKVLNPPFRFSAASVQVAEYAASLGEHGREILERVGFGADEIAAMAADGTVSLSQ